MTTKLAETGLDAASIQTIPVDTTPPSEGQVQTYDAVRNKYTPRTPVVAVSGGGGSTAALIVKEDDSPVDAAATTLDFTEPDATLVTSSPAGEANINMALYAILAGRVGGQTLIGGTVADTYLTLKGNPVNPNLSPVKLDSPLQMKASPNGTILDSGATARLSFATASPQITGSGDVLITGGIQNGAVGAFDPAAFNKIEPVGPSNTGLSIVASGWPTPAVISSTFIQVDGISSGLLTGGGLYGFNFSITGPQGGDLGEIVEVLAQGANNNNFATERYDKFRGGSAFAAGTINGYKRKSAYNANWVFRGGTGTQTIGHQSSALEVTFGAPTSTTKWPNRFGIKMDDPTQAMTAADRAFGLQMDKFDSVAVGEIWPIYYGDHRMVSLTSCFFNDISVGFIDNSTEAATIKGTSFNLFNTDSVAQVDYSYFGHTTKFKQLSFFIGTLGTGTTPVLVWEYSQGGSAWATLTVNTNPTPSFRFNASGVVQFTPPADWAVDTVNGVAATFWVRVKVITTEFSAAPKCFSIQAVLDDGLPAFAVDGSGAVISRIAGSPGVLNDGQIWYDTTQVATRVRNLGTTLGLERLALAQTSIQGGDTVANTAAQTNFATNFSVPANFLQVGKTIRVTARGAYSDTGTPNLTFRVKFGVTVLAASGAVVAGTGQTNVGWEVTADLICITTGATGTIEAQGKATLATTAALSSVGMMVNTATVTVDTTAAQILQLAVTWNAASPSNTITMRQFIVEVFD